MFNKIKEAIKTARLAQDKQVLANLTTLLAEIERKAVDKSGKAVPPTDEHVIATVKKFVANIQAFLDRVPDSAKVAFIAEIALYSQFLPTMTTEAEIVEACETIKTQLGANSIATYMTELKKMFGTSLDGRLASTIVKRFL